MSLTFSSYTTILFPVNWINVNLNLDFPLRNRFVFPQTSPTVCLLKVVFLVYVSGRLPTYHVRSLPSSVRVNLMTLTLSQITPYDDLSFRLRSVNTGMSDTTKLR